MNRESIAFGIILGMAILSIVALIASLGNSVGEEKANQKYADCVTLMQKAIPDPNDVSRASFLQDCYSPKKDANTQ